MRLNSVAAAATSALVLALTACSGGGGTGSGETVAPASPPPPPPPPANTAPQLNYTLSAVSADEGQPFWIDASGSTDEDGDALTITVTQVSGPLTSDVPLYEDIPPSGEHIFAFRAPDVDADAVMEFDVAVTDGKESRIETVAITAANIVMEPVADILGDTLDEFEGLKNPVAAGFYSMSFQQPEAGIIGVEDTEDGSGMTLFRFVNDMLTETFGEKILVPLENSVAGDLVDVEGIIPSIFGAPNFPAFALEQSGKVYITTADSFLVPGSDAENELVVTDVLDVPGACAVNDIWLGSTAYHLLVGTRGNGLRLYLQKQVNGIVVSLTYEPGQVLAEDGELCILSDGNGGTIAAFDASANIIRTWLQQPQGYVEQQSIPVDIPSNAPMLVTARIQSPSNGEVGGAFLFTDGSHDGHHQLTLYFDDGYGGMKTNVYTWTKGIPTDVVSSTIRTIDGHYRSGYFVSLETAPYVIFIAGTDPRYSAPDFGPMEFAPVPLWVSGIESAHSTDLDAAALVLTRNRVGSVSMVELKAQP